MPARPQDLRNQDLIGVIDTRPHAVFFALLALVMLLVASVGKSHLLVIDLPAPYFGDQTELGLPYDRVIITTNDQILWNGLPIDMAQLAELLEQRRTRSFKEGLIFEPEGGARYSFALTVLGIVKRSGNADAGFCFGDLSLHRRFAKPGQAEPAPPQSAGRLYSRQRRALPPHAHRFLIQRAIHSHGRSG